MPHVHLTVDLGEGIIDSMITSLEAAHQRLAELLTNTEFDIESVELHICSGYREHWQQCPDVNAFFGF